MTRLFRKKPWTEIMLILPLISFRHLDTLNPSFLLSMSRIKTVLVTNWCADINDGFAKTPFKWKHACVIIPLA